MSIVAVVKRVAAFLLCLCAMYVDAVFAAPIIGGICVPDSTAIRQRLYETAGFGVRFPGRNVGTVRLMCPFDTEPDEDYEVGATEMSFIDADGMRTGARVRATLRRAARGTNIAESLGTCDSNTSDKTGPQKLVCVLPRGVKLSSSYWWWWEVLIERTDPNVNVEFLGLISLYNV